jgi:hypothetical protein
MGTSVFAWQNAVKTATLAASSANPALPVSNLQGSDQGAPSMGWQTVAGVVAGVLLTITPAVRTTFRVVGAFRTNLTSAATVTVRFYTNPGAVLVETDVIAVPPGQAVVVLAADRAADYLTIQFDDAGNPSGFLNIPLVFAGPAWIPLTAMSFSSTMGRDDLTDTLQSRGGQTYVNMRATNRRWDIALDGVRASEVFSQLDVLDQASRAGGNVLALPDYLSTNLLREACYGLLKASADISWPFGTADRRSWRATLTERL